jgi:hypothetical protein
MIGFYLFWGNFVRAELIVHNVSLYRRKSVPFDVMNLNPRENETLKYANDSFNNYPVGVTFYVFLFRNKFQARGDV